MKIRILYTLFAILSIGFIFLSSSNGRATIANEGNTGAPGDVAPNGRTCQSCHNSASIAVDLNIEVFDLDSNLVTFYMPQDTYRVVTRVNTLQGSPQEYGFQLVSETDIDNASINSFLNPSTNAKLVNTTNGRQYAEHKGPSLTNTFEVLWVAPAAGSGKVTFYAAGNGVNGNNTSSGDGANKTSLPLPEQGGVSAFEPAAPVKSLEVFPNPGFGELNLRTPDQASGLFTLHIRDLSGRIWRQQEVELVNGAFSLWMAEIPTGMYLVSLQDEENLYRTKWIKGSN